MLSQFSVLGLGALCLAIQSVGAVTPWESISAKQFTLEQTDYSSLIAPLDKKLKKVSVEAVVADANHDMSVSGGKYKWPDGSDFNDFGTGKWYPQGITTSADAYDAGKIGKDRVMLTSWYSKEDKGVRVSFINYGLSKPNYRHVLLVEPSGSASAPSFSPVHVHAGGLFWYGNMVYVVDTHGGLRLFDTNHIYQVKDGDGIGRQKDGSYEGYGYKYVLPQVRRYESEGSPKGHPLSFSYAALDRTTTPDSFIVGEYQADATTARLVRWNIDYKTRLLSVDKSGTAVATQAYHFGYKRIQGACSINKRYYLSQSNGDKNGDLFAYTPGQKSVKQYEGHFPTGPEDLSYDQTTGTLWTLTEHPNHRYIVGTQIKDFP